MFCFTVRRNLSHYVDGRLRPELAEKIARHLANCRACAVQHRSLLEGLELLRNADAPRLPDGLWARIAGTVEDRERAHVPYRPARPRTSRALQWAGCAAAAASILMAVYVGFRGAQPAAGPISPERFAAERMRDLANDLRDDPVPLYPALENQVLFRLVQAEEQPR